MHDPLQHYRRNADRIFRIFYAGSRIPFFCFQAIGFSVSPSLKSLQFQGDEVVAVRTLEFYGVSLPPGQPSSELECGEGGKDVVIEESA